MEAPVDTLVSPNCDLFGMVRGVDRSHGLREDFTACRNSSNQEDIYDADNSSSSEGFLDSHECDEDFLLKGLSPSPVRPHFREAAVGYTLVMTAPARAHVGVGCP